MDVEALATVVVDTAFRIHRDLGPGLLESVYTVNYHTHLGASPLRINQPISDTRL